MKIQRTIPPAATPVCISDIARGFFCIFFGRHYFQHLINDLKSYFDVRHLFLVSSGKASLYLILQALKTIRPEKNEVVITGYTCYSVPSVILKAGLKIVVCDIDPANFDFDYAHLSRMINDKTLCIIPANLFGIPSDMDRIKDLVSGREIFIVEDAAQAMGGKYEDAFLGTIGDAGFFSLGRGKNISCGSGGIILTKNDQIGKIIQNNYSMLAKPGVREMFKDLASAILMSIFIHPSLYWFPAGLSFLKLGETFFYKDFPVKQLTGIKAGLLMNWRDKLEKCNRIRTDNAIDLGKRIAYSQKMETPVAYLRFPVLLPMDKKRTKAIDMKKAKQLGISRLYPGTVIGIKEIRDLLAGFECPSAERVARELVTLPTHHLLSEKDKRRIVEKMGPIFQET